MCTKPIPVDFEWVDPMLELDAPGCPRNGKSGSDHGFLQAKTMYQLFCEVIN